MRLLAKPLPRHVRFHDLRHTTATLLLKMGVPLVTVQRTVYRLVAEGQLPAVRVSSGAIRVRDSGLLGRGK
jgi:integrase